MFPLYLFNFIVGSNNYLSSKCR